MDCPEVTWSDYGSDYGAPWCTTEVCLWQNATPRAAWFAPSMEPGCGCTTFGLQIWRKNMEKPDNSWHILTCWTFHSSTHRQIWCLYTISIWEMVHVVAWFPSWPSPSPKFANMALSCSVCLVLGRTGRYCQLWEQLQQSLQTSLFSQVNCNASEVLNGNGTEGRAAESKCMFKAVPMLAEQWVLCLAISGQRVQRPWNDVKWFDDTNIHKCHTCCHKCCDSAPRFHGRL